MPPTSLYYSRRSATLSGARNSTLWKAPAPFQIISHQSPFVETLQVAKVSLGISPAYAELKCQEHYRGHNNKSVWSTGTASWCTNRLKLKWKCMHSFIKLPRHLNAQRHPGGIPISSCSAWRPSSRFSWGAYQLVAQHVKPPPLTPFQKNVCNFPKATIRPATPASHRCERKQGLNSLKKLFFMCTNECIPGP